MFYFDFHWQIQAILNQFWWQINFLLLVILIVVGCLAYKRPVYALSLTIILLPTYLFRSKIWFLPFTYLEFCIWVIFLVILLKSLATKSYKLKAKSYNTYKWPISLILLASTVSVIISPDKIAAAGIWKAYFVEPILFFLILAGTIKTENDKKIILWSLGISTLSISLLAIFQKFSGFAIAEPGWTATANRRVTSIFTSPNAVGLYLGPILAIYFGWLISEIKNYQATILKLLIVVLAALAVIFTVSQGAWLGLAAAIVFLAFFAYSPKFVSAIEAPQQKREGRRWDWNKKIILAAIIGLIVISLTLPIAREKIRPAITFQDQSGQNRLTLWQMGTDYLFSSPKNFVFGAGLTGFSKIQNQLRQPLEMEALLYPHNIFLNFWLETGLLGLIGFIWLVINFFKNGFKKLNNENHWLVLGIMAAMVVVVVHGLIDVPYFKNDLAILFWLTIGLL